MTEETGFLRQTMDQVARRLGVRLNVVVEANSSRVLAELVSGGAVHSIMSIHTIPRYFRLAGRSQVRRVVRPEIRRFTDMRFSMSRPRRRRCAMSPIRCATLLTSQLERPAAKR